MCSKAKYMHFHYKQMRDMVMRCLFSLSFSTFQLTLIATDFFNEIAKLIHRLARIHAIKFFNKPITTVMYVMETPLKWNNSQSKP